MSRFWEHYDAFKASIPGATASAISDIRHKLVEEGWFGKKTTGDNAEYTLPKPEPETAPKAGTPSQTPGPGQSDAIYEEVWGKAPTFAEVYGHTAGEGSALAIGPPEPSQQTRGPEPEV